MGIGCVKFEFNDTIALYTKKTILSRDVRPRQPILLDT